jgi:phosphatidylglycerophosphate synthase
VGKLCLKLGLTPDVLTLTSIPISAVAAYALAKGYYIWSLVAICVAGGLDVLDGATARAGKTGSHFGTVFDHVADRYSEFIIWTGAALNDRAGPLWAMFAISGMVMSSYVRAAAESVGKMESCTVGFMGRVEKFFLLMGGMLIEASPIAFAGLKWSLIAIGVASHVTAVLRLLHARKEILKSVAVTEESE